MLTQKIFGSGGGGLSTVFGPNGLGGELKSAMGNMFGAAVGDAQGFGGLGLRGSGSGGGRLAGPARAAGPAAGPHGTWRWRRSRTSGWRRRWPAAAAVMAM